MKPRHIISYNYKYILSQEFISEFDDKIINLHISLLPWNRGFSPNFWSFIDDTPKGVTIHQIDEGIDTGPIYIQEEVFFNEELETFRSSYDALNRKMIELFIENWKALKEGKCNAKTQKGNGTYHCFKDLKEVMEKYSFDWDMKISEFKKIWKSNSV